MDRETLEKKLAEIKKRLDRPNPPKQVYWSHAKDDIQFLLAECLRLMAEREWVKISPETMPEDHTSWLIAWHNYGTGNMVEEAYWNGEHWCLTRTNPCDESIYLDEQVYAYTKIPDAPEREIVLPTEGGKE